MLQTEEIPRSLKCSHCGQIFSPSRQKRFSAPCPFPGGEQGHSIEAGRELYIQSMEAE
ncbi:hydrogenase/urease maturation nickel metallochaperone HypA [Bilophila wadsworthia]|uniref:hydrogenase/urease maturation nickel metallochaperone HypA n=1 Tax=Bilophila wadsworthia TaxID=35833 RepID=UPI002432B4BE|nr:hydrogenase/urease maturation nickel metallochaperone HypA [Bilophila wadsworthia]